MYKNHKHENHKHFMIIINFDEHDALPKVWCTVGVCALMKGEQ